VQACTRHWFIMFFLRLAGFFQLFLKYVCPAFSVPGFRSGVQRTPRLNTPMYHLPELQGRRGRQDLQPRLNSSTADLKAVFNRVKIVRICFFFIIFQMKMMKRNPPKKVQGVKMFKGSGVERVERDSCNELWVQCYTALQNG